MRLASMRLASAGDKVEVLVVTKENKKMVVKQLRAWNKSINQSISRERLEKLLFVSPFPINLPKPAKVHNWSYRCHNLFQGAGGVSVLVEHLLAVDTSRCL